MFLNILKLIWSQFLVYVPAVYNAISSRPGKFAPMIPYEASSTLKQARCPDQSIFHVRIVNI